MASPSTQSLSPMPYSDLSPSLSAVPCCYGNREAEYAAEEAGPADLACLHGDWGREGTFFKPGIWTPGSSPQLCLLPGGARENLSTYLLPLLTPWPAGMSQDHGEGMERQRSLEVSGSQEILGSLLLLASWAREALVPTPHARHALPPQAPLW